MSQRHKSLLGEIKRRWSNFRTGDFCPEDTFSFIEFNRRKWTQRRRGDNVVLVGQLASKPATFCYSHVTNFLADKYNARIESYDFSKRRSPVKEEIYSSFGAVLTLRLGNTAGFESEVKNEKERIAGTIHSKKDVLDIKIDGLLVGDLIYNSYLRFYNKPTLHLDDPCLLEVIEQACEIYYACKAYLRKNRVSAFFTDDFSYIGIGIITRMLFLAGAPIYLSLFGPRYWILKLDPLPSRAGHNFPPSVGLHYYSYPEEFQKLNGESRERGIALGRKVLENRLSGKFDPLVDLPCSTYSAPGSRLLAEGSDPRILVMMHDFIDSPHCYRHMLFPDFVEWISFLLSKAVLTPFQWYVKPYPFNLLSGNKPISKANQKVVEDLKVRFPQINFISPEASNRQILDEGISSMFTVHGTAAHEFAYSGVPVVNCGDNPHINYNFNFHAGNLEEYERLIFNAGHLRLDIDRRQIEEFVYMHNFYYPERDGAPVNPIPGDFFTDPQKTSLLDGPDGFGLMMRNFNPEREAGFKKYLEGYFSK